MAEPSNQAELLADTNAEREATLLMLRGLTPEERTRPGPGGWSAKDIVAHLSDWERLLIDWYEAGVRGKVPALPAPGYTWDTIDALNEVMHERHVSEAWPAVLADWEGTSDQMIGLVGALSNDQLFHKGRYEWTGEDSLASYVVECGPNHYRWARVEIAKAIGR